MKPVQLLKHGTPYIDQSSITNHNHRLPIGHGHAANLAHMLFLLPGFHFLPLIKELNNNYIEKQQAFPTFPISIGLQLSQSFFNDSSIFSFSPLFLFFFTSHLIFYSLIFACRVIGGDTTLIFINFFYKKLFII